MLSATPIARANAKPKMRNMKTLLVLGVGARFRAVVRLGVVLLGRVGILCVGRFLRSAADHEFADKVLELYRRLRQHEFVAVLERLGRSARLDRNVLVTQ